MVCAPTKSHQDQTRINLSSNNENKGLYEESYFLTVVNTERFEITTGVRQRDIFFLMMLFIVVDWIMKRVIGDEDGIETSGSDRVADLVYADNIALLSEVARSMNRMK